MEILNKKCIVRCYGAGVFFGTVTKKENTPSGVEVELKDARRIWYWSGAASLSQLATEGVKNQKACKFTVVVPELLVTQCLEIIPATEAAIANLESVAVWKI